jgi:lysophospholipase L1-like esterase
VAQLLRAGGQLMETLEPAQAEPKHGCFRPLLRVAMALLWLIVLALAAEAALQLWNRSAKTDNPYLLSRDKGQLWPRHEEAASALNVDVSPANPQRLPVPTQEAYALAHARHFAASDPAFDESYALVMDRLAGTLEGGAVKRYAPESWENAAQVDALLDTETPADVSIRAAAAALTPEAPVRCLELGPQLKPYESACVALAGDAGPAVFFLQRPVSGAQPGTTWDRPYMSYLPHADEAGQAQVYGHVPEFRLNNFGFRDDDVQLPKPPGVLRIVCIGASTTEEGSSNGFTYPNLVERFLNERFGAGRVEVINAGVSGTRTVRERARFADYLMMEPDLIVFYNGVNDICHEILPRWALIERGVGMAATRSALLSAILKPTRIPGDDVAVAALREFPGANIRAMAEYARSLGVDTAVCSFAAPDWDSMDSDERAYYSEDAQRNWTGIFYTFQDYLHLLELWNAEVRRLTDELDLLYIPVAESIKGGAEIFGDICHMRDRGMEMKSRVVVESLEPYVAAKLGAAQ